MAEYLPPAPKTSTLSVGTPEALRMRRAAENEGDASVKYTKIGDFKRALNPRHIQHPYAEYYHALGQHKLLALWLYQFYHKELVFWKKYLKVFDTKRAIGRKVQLIVTDEQEKVYNGLNDVVEDVLVFGKTLVAYTDNAAEFRSYTPDRYWIDDDGKIHIVEELLKDGLHCWSVDKDRKTQSYKVVLNSQGYYQENTGTPNKIAEDVVMFEVESYLGDSDVRIIAPQVLNIDAVETTLTSELMMTRTTIHVDVKYTKDGIIQTKDGYSIYSPSSLDGAKPLFEVSQPEIREQAYADLALYYKRELASALGVSPYSLGIQLPNNQLATIALQEEELTLNTINATKAHLTETITQFIPKFVGFGQYSSNSLTSRTTLVEGLKDHISIESKLKILYPEANEDTILRESALIKIEQGIPMTKKEEDYARKEGLIGTSTLE